jgi:hypothetical protein
LGVTDVDEQLGGGLSCGSGADIQHAFVDFLQFCEPLHGVVVAALIEEGMPLCLDMSYNPYFVCLEMLYNLVIRGGRGGGFG